MRWSSFLFLKPLLAVAKCGFENKKSGNGNSEGSERPEGAHQKKTQRLNGKMV
jgi:hypothetical protein